MRFVQKQRYLAHRSHTSQITKSPKPRKRFGTAREDPNLKDDSLTLYFSDDVTVGDEDLKQAFSLFDFDQDGLIDVNEFKATLSYYLIQI